MKILPYKNIFLPSGEEEKRVLVLRSYGLRRKGKEFITERPPLEKCRCKLLSWKLDDAKNKNFGSEMLVIITGDFCPALSPKKMCEPRYACVSARETQWSKVLEVYIHLV